MGVSVCKRVILIVRVATIMSPARQCRPTTAMKTATRHLSDCPGRRNCIPFFRTTLGSTERGVSSSS
jgi:hypothetical protein